MAHSADQGHSPKQNAGLTERQSHRRTSSGKAVKRIAKEGTNLTCYTEEVCDEENEEI